MRTEDSLRAAIDELAAEAPASDHIVNEFLVTTDRGRQAQLRRRRLLPMAAALTVAVVAALLIAVTWGVNGRHRGSVPASPTPSTASSLEAMVMAQGRHCVTTATPHFDTFAIDPVPGIGTTMVAATTCAGLRNRGLYTSGGGAIGDITLYAPGVFDQSVLAGAKKVRGHGVTGYVMDLPGDPSATFCPLDPRIMSPVCSATPTLVWQYQSGAWAVMPRNTFVVNSYGANPVDKQLAIAAAVRPDQLSPLRSPFQLSRLPANLRAFRAEAGHLHDRPTWGEGAQIELGRLGAGAGCHQSQVCYSAVLVDVTSSIDTQLGSGFIGRHVSINGHPAVFVKGGGRLIMAAGHWSVDISVTIQDAHITDDDLAAIATAMTLAPSYTDTSTWFTVDDALPR